MKLAEHTKSIARSQDFDSVSCTIDAEDMRYISSLLRNNYSNTVLATIRETYANAVDATVENGKSESQIIVTMPSAVEPTFSIRDFGKGLSRDEIFNLYSKYGKSTKRTSNEAIGGFGIGRFAPLSYNKDGFTVTSFYEGKKYIYLVYISENNDTKIDEIHVSESNECSGIMVSVAVSNNDIQSFADTATSFFCYFNLLPKFEGHPIKIKNEDKFLSGDNWFIERNDYYGNNHKVIMGGISYPLNSSLVKFKKTVWGQHINGLCLILPVGSVSIHHSRESLEYNKKTQEYIDNAIVGVEREISNQIKKQFASLDCIKKARRLYSDISLSFKRSDTTSSLISSGVFNFKGIDINSRYFDNLFYINNKKEQIRVPVLNQTAYKNASGRVSFSRAYHVDSSSDSCYVVHDLEEGAKVINRIYHLFDKYQNVYIIRHNQEVSNPENINGALKFYELNRLDLVKEDCYKLSQLEPRKITAYTKTKNSSSVSSNYFWNIDSNGYYRKTTQDNINDDSVLNIFFEIKDKKPSANYSFLEHDSYRHTNERVKNSILSSIKEVYSTNDTPIEIYAVSVATSTSKKMKSMNHFIDLKTFIKNKWNEHSDNIKSLIKEAIQHSFYEDEQRYKWCKQHILSLSFFDKFENRKNEITKSLIDDGVSENEIKLWHQIFRINKYIGIDFGAIIESEVFRQTINKINERYPLIDTFYELSNRCYGDVVEKTQKNLTYYLDLERNCS